MTTVCCSEEQKEVRKAQEWARSRAWAPKELTAQLHPSVDVVEFYRQYHLNKDVWDASFRALVDVPRDLPTYLNKGRVDVMGDHCYVNVMEFTPKAPYYLEGHRQYADIQLLRGHVLWGVAPVDQSVEVDPYNAEIDNAFFTSEATQVYEQQAEDDCLFIFFPADVHQPSYAVEGEQYPEPIVKIVVKVEVKP